MSATSPGAGELLEIVETFLRRLAETELEGANRFQAIVAANSLAVVTREIVGRAHADAEAGVRLAALLGVEGRRAELDALLCDRIAGRRLPGDGAALADHLLRSAADEVAIDQPRYATLALFRKQMAEAQTAGE